MEFSVVQIADLALAEAEAAPGRNSSPVSAPGHSRTVTHRRRLASRHLCGHISGTVPLVSKTMPTSPPRLLFATLALLAIAAQLAWEAAHGGIVTHHLLARPDMPGLSNAWGLLILPALAAWTAGRVPQRGDRTVRNGLPLLAGFGLSLLFGVSLSAAFALKATALTEALFLALLALAALLPVYRRECLFGLVLGMCFVFGPVLPTLVGSVIAAASWLLHRVVRWAWRLTMAATRRPSRMS